jgi:hypothetical protein
MHLLLHQEKDMDSPLYNSSFSLPVSPPGQQRADFSSAENPEESMLQERSDRLYQIAALAAGIILLATVF